MFLILSLLYAISHQLTVSAVISIRPCSSPWMPLEVPPEFREHPESCDTYCDGICHQWYGFQPEFDSKHTLCFTHKKPVAHHFAQNLIIRCKCVMTSNEPDSSTTKECIPDIEVPRNVSTESQCYQVCSQYTQLSMHLPGSVFFPIMCTRITVPELFNVKLNGYCSQHNVTSARTKCHCGIRKKSSNRNAYENELSSITHLALSNHRKILPRAYNNTITPTFHVQSQPNNFNYINTNLYEKNNEIPTANYHNRSDKGGKKDNNKGHSPSFPVLHQRNKTQIPSIINSDNLVDKRGSPIINGKREKGDENGGKYASKVARSSKKPPCTSKANKKDRKSRSVVPLHLSRGNNQQQYVPQTAGKPEKSRKLSHVSENVNSPSTPIYTPSNRFRKHSGSSSSKSLNNSNENYITTTDIEEISLPYSHNNKNSPGGNSIPENFLPLPDCSFPIISGGLLEQLMIASSSPEDISYHSRGENKNNGDYYYYDNNNINSNFDGNSISTNGQTMTADKERSSLTDQTLMEIEKNLLFESEVDEMISGLDITKTTIYRDLEKSIPDYASNDAPHPNPDDIENIAKCEKWEPRSIIPAIEGEKISSSKKCQKWCSIGKGYLDNSSKAQCFTHKRNAHGVLHKLRDGVIIECECYAKLNARHKSNSMKSCNPPIAMYNATWPLANIEEEKTRCQSACHSSVNVWFIYTEEQHSVLSCEISSVRDSDRFTVPLIGLYNHSSMLCDCGINVDEWKKLNNSSKDNENHKGPSKAGLYSQQVVRTKKKVNASGEVKQRTQKEKNYEVGTLKSPLHESFRKCSFPWEQKPLFLNVSSSVDFDLCNQNCDKWCSTKGKGYFTSNNKKVICFTHAKPAATVTPRTSIFEPGSATCKCASPPFSYNNSSSQECEPQIRYVITLETGTQVDKVCNDTCAKRVITYVIDHEDQQKLVLCSESTRKSALIQSQSLTGYCKATKIQSSQQLACQCGLISPTDQRLWQNT